MLTNTQQWKTITWERVVDKETRDKQKRPTIKTKYPAIAIFLAPILSNNRPAISAATRLKMLPGNKARPVTIGVNPMTRCKIIGSIMLVAIGIMKVINMIVIPKENMG